MASLERRIQHLEELWSTDAASRDPAAELRRAVYSDVMDEFARLGACRARGVYRGGTPPTPIQPTDPAGEALGYPYTTGELLEFAVKTVFERDREEAPEILSPETVEDLIAAWTENLRANNILGERWDEVQADGPPEPMSPWRGG